MSRARAPALLLIALTVLAAGGPVVPPKLAPWLDTAHDQVLQRSFVPDAAQKVGEVRILRRGDATVVETLIYSRLGSRAVAEIRKKELANWPGSAERAAYLEALSQVQKTVERRLPTDRAADRRQKIWIDFVVAPEVAFIAIGAFESRFEGGEVQVVSREPLALLQPSREYVERNQRLIAADSFRVEDPATLLPEHWK